MAKRIIRCQLEDLFSLRKQIAELQVRERALTTTLNTAMGNRKTVVRGEYTLEKKKVVGTPAYKQAFIDVAGQDAADKLPRPTHERINITKES